MSRRVGQIVIYAVVASLSLLGGAEPSSVRADERPTATEGDVGEVVKGDMLGLYRVPGAFLAEGPFPILELETIQFVDGSQIKEKGSRITFSLPAGNPLLGEVALTFRDPQRSAMGVTLRAPDGTPAILHFDYNADGSFNSGLLLANKNNLSYSFSKTSKGTYLILLKRRIVYGSCRRNRTKHRHPHTNNYTDANADQHTNPKRHQHRTTDTHREPSDLYPKANPSTVRRANQSPNERAH